MEDPISSQFDTGSRDEQAQNTQSAAENYDSDNSEERLSARRGKVMSSVVAVPNNASEPSSNTVDNNTFSNKSKRKKEEEDFTEVSRPEIKEVFTRPEVINHNKRLFGSLMGHLGMARTKLEKDSDKIQKQKDVQTAASLRSTELLKRVGEQKELLRRKSLCQSKVDEVRSSSTAWKSNLEATSTFLVTDVEPRLCWIPANANQVSKQLVEKRKEEVSSLTCL